MHMAHSAGEYLGQFILLDIWEIAQMRQKNYSIAEVMVDSQYLNVLSSSC